MEIHIGIVDCFKKINNNSAGNVLRIEMRLDLDMKPKRVDI